MTAATIDRPVVESHRRLVDGPGDVDHFDCCDPNEALCGQNITGWDDVDDDPNVPTCPLCEEAIEQDLPCADPACPIRRGVVAAVRRWWRSL